MKPETLVEELKNIAEQLGVTVRQEIGSFNGGYCVLREQKLIVVNKKLMPHIKAAVLAQSLCQFPLEGVFMKPALRDYIEEQADRLARARSIADTLAAAE